MGLGSQKVVSEAVAGLMVQSNQGNTHTTTARLFKVFQVEIMEAVAEYQISNMQVAVVEVLDIRIIIL